MRMCLIAGIIILILVIVVPAGKLQMKIPHSRKITDTAAIVVATRH